LDSENIHTHRELQDNEADKQDILKFVEHLQEKDKSILGLLDVSQLFTAIEKKR
jgi:hypothetical protein